MSTHSCSTDDAWTTSSNDWTRCDSPVESESSLSSSVCLKWLKVGSIWMLHADFPDLPRWFQYVSWGEWDDWRHIPNPDWHSGWGDPPEWIPANMAARGK